MFKVGDKVKSRYNLPGRVRTGRVVREYRDTVIVEWDDNERSWHIPRKDLDYTEEVIFDE